MNVTRETLRNLLHDETAAGAIEYVLLASLIALATVAALHNFGKKVGKDYNKIGKKI
jgi:Flp pilus assembly pilin Flp